MFLKNKRQLKKQQIRDMNKTKEFVVYFEIFGIRKKYIVYDHNIKTQNEAELYVSQVVIPKNTRFHNNVKQSYEKSNRNVMDLEPGKAFSILNRIYNEFYKTK
jgi:hypothetical protein